MDKLDKIINALEMSLNLGICGNCLNECEYGDKVVSCKTLLRDVLALLKEQEPVEPKMMEFVDKGVTWEKYEVPTCGVCGALLGDALFCPTCGRAVKWG